MGTVALIILAAAIVAMVVVFLVRKKKDGKVETKPSVVQEPSKPTPKFKIGEWVRFYDGQYTYTAQIANVRVLSDNTIQYVFSDKSWLNNGEDKLSLLTKDEVEELQKPEKSVCEGCNNFEACIDCENGSRWAHIQEPVVEPEKPKEEEKGKEVH